MNRLRYLVSLIRGAVLSRATVSQYHATLATERNNALLELSSLRELLKARNNEIDILKRENTEKTATIAVREHEVQELNLWLERIRARLSADIAQEVARETRALTSPEPRSNI